ncbi:MAG: acetylxylan esterase, partial [Akkermansiaceae bacterium]|nr:acetylxylan esterase [Akkermansiaceae bacterium]
MSFHPFVAMIAGLLFAGSLSAREGANYDEAKVGTFELPDPLQPAGGAPVRSQADWLSHGRPATLALFEQHVFGKTPGGPMKLDFETLSVRKDALAGLATRRVIRIRLADVPAWTGIEMLVYTPNAATAPVPAFVGLNFGGNHTVSPETDIPLTTKSGSAANPARGLAASRWPLELILKRGYGLATAYCGDVEPDHPAGWRDGLRGALTGPGKTTWGEGEWGALGAWAWGLSRMLDGLETLPEVDARHCAVIGHSRLGKTALWAGAQDQRFALVVSNNSGEGGAALKYRDFGETPAIITSSFPYWFTATYLRYGPAPRSCPVDQHQLLALVAPRLLYVASATDDRWADPQGEFLAAKSAGAVYALFGKTGVAVDTQPPPEHPVGDSIGYHLRTGKHDITAYDWKQYLDFADRDWGGGGGGVELHVATS